MVPVLEESAELEAPLLLLFGGKDAAVSRPQVDRIQAELGYRERHYEMQTYPEAGAGFFCDERSAHDAAASADGWKRTQEWFARHLG